MHIQHFVVYLTQETKQKQNVMEIITKKDTFKIFELTDTNQFAVLTMDADFYRASAYAVFPTRRDAFKAVTKYIKSIN